MWVVQSWEVHDEAWPTTGAALPTTGHDRCDHSPQGRECASLAPQPRHPDFSRVIRRTRPFVGERAMYLSRLFQTRALKWRPARDHDSRPGESPFASRKSPTQERRIAHRLPTSAQSVAQGDGLQSTRKNFSSRISLQIADSRQEGAPNSRRTFLPSCVSRSSRSLLGRAAAATRAATAARPATAAAWAGAALAASAALGLGARAAARAFLTAARTLIRRFHGYLLFRGALDCCLHRERRSRTRRITVCLRIV